jgi:Tfp pilus assembly protein PilF
MRGLMWGIILTVVLGLAQYGFGASYPDQPTQDMKSMSVAELEKAADAYRAQKDYQHAIEYFREALRKDKNNAVLYNKIGMAELKSGDLRGARWDFEKAAKLNKKYPEALNNLGVVYYAESNWNQAAKYCKRAVALEETRATFHLNLGTVWFSQKKMDRAMAEYRRALELDPQVLLQSSRTGITAQVASPEERANFYYLLAKIQAQRGDVDECLVCLKKAKENGHRSLANVYKDETFKPLWTDARLGEIVPPPQAN